MKDLKSAPIPENDFSRREFMKKCIACSVGYFALSRMSFAGQLLPEETNQLHKAKYWKPLTGGETQCLLCPNECTLRPGANGICHSRGNRDGEFYSLVYGRPAVISLDEIEKSPLYHYQIKENAFSIATSGCNLDCQFCQNWKITQAGPDEVETFKLEPKEVIRRAKKNKVNSINFFYSEPTVYFEYMLDIAALAKKENMKTFCITAGYINDEPLNELIPYIDAFVLGIKSFDETFYKKYIGCSVEPIKKTLKTLAKHKDKTWFEIVNLLITDLNDQEESIRQMCWWIAQEAGNDVPVHFTRFEPAYKMPDTLPTPVSTLENSYNIAKECGLNYVYIGNLPGHKGNNTFCPACKEAVIERINYKVVNNSLKNGKCSCGNKIPGFWI